MRHELDAIIKLAHDHDAVILSDEVYEHITFAPHLSVASRPGGWERTLTISSIGKTFSVTGWKIGWAFATGAPHSRAYAWRISGYLLRWRLLCKIASAEILQRANDRDYYEGLERTSTSASATYSLSALNKDAFQTSCLPEGAISSWQTAQRSLIKMT